MKPLDRGEYYPFKIFYSKAVDNCMVSLENVEKFLTIYNIAELVSTAYSKAKTVQ